MLLTSTKALIDHRFLTTLMAVELILAIELKLAIGVLIMAIEVAKMGQKLSKNSIEFK